MDIRDDHIQPNENKAEVHNWLTYEKEIKGDKRIILWRKYSKGSSGCPVRGCEELCLLSPSCGAEWRVFSVSQASGFCWLQPGWLTQEIYLFSLPFATAIRVIVLFYFPQKYWVLAVAKLGILTGVC